MLENIRLSFQGIWSHKMRSFLTMLGIIIGIASIISIVSTIQGTNEQLMQNVIGAGNNAVSIPLSRSSDYEMSFDYESVPYGVPVIGEDTREKLLAVDGVEDAAFYTSRTYADGIYHQNTALQGANVYGIDMHYFNVNGYIVRTGRGFVEDDYTEFRKVVILDQTAASSLFQEENAVGKTIEINSEPFTVIGVAQVASQFEPVINSMEDYYTYMGYDNASGTVYIPSSAWGIVYQFDEPQHVAVKAASVEAMTTIGKPCAEILNANLYTNDSDLKYRAKNTLETVEQQQQINESTNQQLIWIASISLLVGGIGVANTMIISVLERRKEIGLRRSLGAKRGHITVQFLAEALLLSFLGGLAGCLIGAGVTWGMCYAYGWPPTLHWWVIAAGLGATLLIGAVAGLYPAIRAARTPPTAALASQ